MSPGRKLGDVAAQVGLLDEIGLVHCNGCRVYQASANRPEAARSPRRASGRGDCAESSPRAASRRQRSISAWSRTATRRDHHASKLARRVVRVVEVAGTPNESRSCEAPRGRSRPGRGSSRPRSARAPAARRPRARSRRSRPPPKEPLDDALVDALVAAAQQGEVGLPGQLADERLVEPTPGRRQQDHAPRSGSSDSTARNQTSGRITMPGPPPNGASSTVRCGSSVWSRRSCTRTSSTPASMALPNRLCRAVPTPGPGRS